jgi:hypothetical protein
MRGSDGRHPHSRPATLPALLTLVVLCAATLLGAAGAATAAAAAPAPKQWTVMLYLDGENREIQSDMLAAFAGMIAGNVGSDADVNIVAQFDRIPRSSAYGGWTEAHRFYVTPGMEPTPANAVADWGDGQGGREVDMSQGSTLRDFVTWAAQTYPADRYALIVADHGYGWKGLCIDETSLGNIMPVKDFASALTGLPFHVDYLGLDTCLMQSAEVGYELRGCDIDVVQGSEAPASTWPLAGVLELFTDDPGIASEDLAARIGDLYFAFHPDQDDLTMSAYRLPRMAPLAASVNALAAELASPDGDLVPQRAGEVLTQLRQAVFTARTGSDFPAAHGLSVFFPDFAGTGAVVTIPTEFLDHYRQDVTAFSADAGWRGLLWRYYTRQATVYPRLQPARAGVTMIEDTADLYDLCVRLASPPPTTTSFGDDPDWHRVPVTVTFTATAAAGGLPVSFTEYRLDGGAWTRGTSVTVPAPRDHSGDGTHTVDYRSADTATPATVAAANRGYVKIDTEGPVTWTQGGATVRRGGVAVLRYRVDDALSETAAVTIRITGPTGRTVRVVKATRVTNRSARSRVRCTMPKGTYRFVVCARDLAGNTQTRMGRNRLVVK